MNTHPDDGAAEREIDRTLALLDDLGAQIERVAKVLTGRRFVRGPKGTRFEVLSVSGEGLHQLERRVVLRTNSGSQHGVTVTGAFAVYCPEQAAAERVERHIAERRRRGVQLR